MSEGSAHTNVSLTPNAYSHVPPDTQREVAGKLDAVIGRDRNRRSGTSVPASHHATVLDM